MNRSGLRDPNQEYPNSRDNSERIDNSRYISNMCRNGPMPISRHKQTDLICILIYLFVLVLTLILFLIDFLIAEDIPEPKFEDLSFWNQLASMLNLSFTSVALCGLSIVAIGILLLVLILILPAIMGYISLLLCFAILGLILYD